MKLAIFGDTHFGVSKSSDIYHNYFKKSFDFYFGVCEDRGVSAIIQTGDLYDHRREVHFNTILKAREYFIGHLLQSNYRVGVIAGNHDCMYKNTNRINSLRSLHEKDFSIIDQIPQTVTLCGFVIDLFPWINESNIEASLNLASKSDSEYCVGHFEFANFPLYPGNIADHGMDHKLFKRYKKVFSGHYHTRSMGDNVYYVGTPYELTWGDYNDPKGIVILDTETGDIEFVQNPYTLFTRLTYEEGSAIDENLIRDHYVKIIVGDKPNQKKFDAWLDKIRSYGPHDVKVIESSIAEAVASAVSQNTKVDMISTQSVIQSVVEHMDTRLDKGLLMKKITEVYAEAEQLIA